MPVAPFQIGSAEYPNLNITFDFHAADAGPSHLLLFHDSSQVFYCGTGLFSNILKQMCVMNLRHFYLHQSVKLWIN